FVSQNGMKDFTDCCPSCSSRAYFARFPDNRRGSAGRRGRGRVPQLVTADGERPLLFSPAPIGERGGLDLEGKGLVRRVDGYGAEVGEASSDDRLVFLRSGCCAVVGGNLGKIGT